MTTENKNVGERNFDQKGCWKRENPEYIKKGIEFSK